MYLGATCPGCSGTDTRIVDCSNSERSHRPRGICDNPGCEFKAPRRHTIEDAIDIFTRFQVQPRWKIWYRDQRGEKKVVYVDVPLQPIQPTSRQFHSDFEAESHEQAAALGYASSQLSEYDGTVLTDLLSATKV